MNYKIWYAIKPKQPNWTIHLQIIYEVHTISLQTFFLWAFKIVVDSWKLSMLLLR